MEDKPYSDKRWNSPMIGIDSECCSCVYWEGFGKCKKYRQVPKEIMDKSFPMPGTGEFDINYCKYRENKEE